MAKHFPKLITDTKPQIQEDRRTPSRVNTKNLYLGISCSTAENQRGVGEKESEGLRIILRL